MKDVDGCRARRKCRRIAGQQDGGLTDRLLLTQQAERDTPQWQPNAHIIQAIWFYTEMHKTIINTGNLVLY